MSFQELNGTWTQKGIQRVLEEQNLWPIRGVNLECLRPKYFNCQVASECKICIKGTRCDSCKSPKEHSLMPCLKARKCDACVKHSQTCQCISKKYYSTCIGKKKKCLDCEKLLPKCSSDCKFFTFINFLSVRVLLIYN